MQQKSPTMMHPTTQQVRLSIFVPVSSKLVINPLLRHVPLLLISKAAKQLLRAYLSFLSGIETTCLLDIILYSFRPSSSRRRCLLSLQPKTSNKQVHIKYPWLPLSTMQCHLGRAAFSHKSSTMMIFERLCEHWATVRVIIPQ